MTTVCEFHHKYIAKTLILQRPRKRKTLHENEMETSELHRSVWTMIRRRSAFKNWTQQTYECYQAIAHECNGRTTLRR